MSSREERQRTYEERVLARETQERHVGRAVAYLRNAETLLYGLEGERVPTCYWALLDRALDAALAIVERLPDDFFETTTATGFFDGQPFKHNLSDGPAEQAEELAAALASRRKATAKLGTIRKLESVAGRTPEEAEAYRRKAAELRGRGMSEERLPIIGRERAIADQLGQLLLGAANKRYEWSPLSSTRRGCTFRVAMKDFPAGASGTKVMEVTVEMLHPDDVTWTSPE